MMKNQIKMSKAEELSQNRYLTLAEKYAFIDGYEQAEKDLELTWEDLKMIDEISDQVYAECDVDAFDEKEYYQEVLKRFLKERKEK